MTSASGADRAVTVAIIFMYAAIPLYGTFVVLDPVRPPIPPLVSLAGAIAIGLAMLAAAAVCAWGARRRPAPRLFVAAQLSGGAAIVLAALLGFDPPTGLKLGAIVLAQGCVGIAVYGYAGLPGVARAIVTWTLGSAVVSIALAVLMVVSRQPAATFSYNNGRAIGTFLNPNELAAYALVIVGLAAGVAFFAEGRGLRSLAAVTAVLALVGLGLTFSRWGFFAAGTGLVFFALTKPDRRVWVALAVAALLAVAIDAGPGRSHHNPRDDVSRVVAWTTGLRTFAHFPLTGVGPFAFQRTYDVLRPPEAPGPDAPVAYDPHSLPLAYLAGSGLVGFGALIFTWLVYVRAILLQLRTAPARRRAIALALGAGLLALDVHVLVNTISIFFPLTTQGLALTLALAQRGLDAAEA